MEEQTQTKESKRGLGKGLKKYFLDFLVVVCGIAVTFMVNSWINYGKEKKLVESHLEAVRQELQYNLLHIYEKVDYYTKVNEFGEYLRSKNRSEHHIDSVRKASYFTEGWSILEVFGSLRIETSAVEAMKFSGSLNQLEKQEFTRALIRAYQELADAKSAVDGSENRKLQIAQNDPENVDPDVYMNMDILHPLSTELYLFHSDPFRLDLTLLECAVVLENTLSMFSKN